MADGPGSQTEMSRALLLRADFAIVPCKASMLEVRALAKAIEVLRQAQDIRDGKPTAVAVLSMVGSNYRLTKDMKEAAEALGLPLADSALTLRQIYADAPGQADLVWNMGAKARSAAEEVDAVFREILPDASSGTTSNVVSMTSRVKRRANELGRGEMASKRMSLVEGLRRDEENLDPAIAENFIKFGNAQPKAEPKPDYTAEPVKTMYSANLPPVEPPQQKRTPRPAKQTAVMTPALISVNVRVRPEIATALQTATLQRQMQGQEPSSKREIVEEVLEPWLRENGYLN